MSGGNRARKEDTGGAVGATANMRLSKDEILELYLNTVSYGHQAIGVDAAAGIYFGKSVGDLDLAECALLAGLPQAPRHTIPSRISGRRSGSDWCFL